MRVAVVGAGYFAQFQIEAWARHPDASLAAVCDLDAEKAKAAADAHGAEAWTDVAAMLRTVKPDLLDIATPPASHLPLVRLAVEQGVHCVCQKPLAPTLAEAEQIVSTAAEAGVSLIVHENFRFQPWYREIRKQIDSGRLGDPYQVSFRLRPGDGQGTEAYLARQPYFQEMQRFLMHETGIHLIDVFRYLLGEVDSVFADLRRLNPAIAGEDAGQVLFRFAGGARGLFDGNRLAGHRARNPRLTMGEMLLEGSEGSISLDGDGGLNWLPLGGEAEPIPYEWRNVHFGGDCVYALQDHVLRHFADGADIENPAADYLTNMRIVEAAYRSAETERWAAV